jgi:hypothetical protein
VGILFGVKVCLVAGGSVLRYLSILRGGVRAKGGQSSDV